MIVFMGLLLIFLDVFLVVLVYLIVGVFGMFIFIIGGGF